MLVDESFCDFGITIVSKTTGDDEKILMIDIDGITYAVLDEGIPELKNAIKMFLENKLLRVH